MSRIMDEIAARIEAEEAKIRFLEDELKARRQRLQALRSALETLHQEDPLDALIADRVAHSLTQPTPPQAAGMQPALELRSPPVQKTLNAQEWPMPAASGARAKRQLHGRGEVKNAILQMLSPQQSHIGKVMAMMKEAGYDLPYNRVRTQLWSYKEEGLVESHQRGFYQLTKQGEAYVERLKGESPVAAGLSGETTDLA